MKKFCKDCFWFTHEWDLKDKKFTCKNLGSNSEDISCGDYQSGIHAEEKTTPEVVLNSIQTELAKTITATPESFFNISQKENLFNIISDIFKMEQDVSVVVEKIKSEINRQGVHLPFATNLIENFTSKLSDLYLLYRLTLSFGLGSYRDDIMKLKIEALFSDPRKYDIKPKPFANEHTRGNS
jgi:hypothetical protein